MKKYFRALCVALVALTSTNAMALDEGYATNISEMQSKLASEGQVRVLSAATGSSTLIRGVSIYLNARTRKGYLLLTDSVFDLAKQAKVVYLLTELDDFRGNSNSKVSVPQPITGIKECEVLIANGSARKDDCGSLYSTLKSSYEAGRTVFVHGRMTGGNSLTVVVNRETREGAAYESTPGGATVTKLSLALIVEP